MFVGDPSLRNLMAAVFKALGKCLDDRLFDYLLLNTGKKKINIFEVKQHMFIKTGSEEAGTEIVLFLTLILHIPPSTGCRW